MRRRSLIQMVCVMVFGGAVLASACSKSSPIQDLRPSLTTTGSATQPAQITGALVDTAWRGVGGGAVQLSDDANTRLATTSDGTGRFEFAGNFTSRVTLTANKDGFRSGTSVVDVSRANGRPVSTSIMLAPTDSVTLQTGAYGLTFVAASECRDIPDELRTRTYEAAVTPIGTSGSQYYLTAKAPGLSSEGFAIGIAGDYLQISDESGFQELLQQSPLTTLSIYGWAEAHLAGPTVSALSVPYDGFFSYCAMKGPKGSSTYNCFQAKSEVAVSSECQSKNHRLILEAR